MDNITPTQRSEIMARVKSKDTRPEVYFRKLLHGMGYRYSLHSKKIPGHPDIWLRKYRTAIFVHGCFWHRHEGCALTRTPKSNIDFWEAKFTKNIERDLRVREELAKENIKCLIIWECTIKKMKKDQSIQDLILQQTEDFLLSDMSYLEL